MAERGNQLLRFIDDVAGPPLLRLSAFFKLKKTPSNDPKKIGVMCFGALGDMLLLSAIVPSLQKAYPKAEIILLGSGTNKSIAPLLPLSNFVELPVKRPDIALKKLKSLGLDIILDSTQWAKLPALLCARSGAYTIGFKTEGQSRHFAYDVVVDHLNTRHEMENFNALASEIAPVMQSSPVLVVEETARANVTHVTEKPFAVLHPWPSGAKAELKEWPLENWAKLAHHLHAQHGLNIVLTGAPLDVPKSDTLAEVIGCHDWLLNTTGKMQLPKTVACLEQATLTVSVNTGIMHMAATFDVPLVGLSGPTNPLRWGPLSDRAENPKPNCEDCWYLNLGFEYPENPADCMGAISLDSVIAAADRVLK